MRETHHFYHHNKDGVQDYLVVLTFEYGEEENQWVAVCRELGTSAYGVTLDEARSQVLDAVGLQLQETEELGFVWDYLRDNWVAAIPTGTPSKPGFSLVK